MDPMFPEPLDVVEKIEWVQDRPRRERRQSAFLAKRQCEDPEEGAKRRLGHPNSEILLLPAPVARTATEVARAGGPGKGLRAGSTGHTLLSSVRRRACVLLNPALLIGYVHAVLNAFVLCAIVYVTSYMLYFITADIVYKIHSKKEEARAVVSEAGRLYVLNRCDPTTRVPALEAQCGEWGHLMRNGLSGIRYTRAVVETCADVLDGFVSRFSIKSCVVFAAAFIAYLIFRR